MFFLEFDMEIIISLMGDFFERQEGLDEKSSLCTLAKIMTIMNGHLLLFRMNTMICVIKTEIGRLTSLGHRTAILIRIFVLRS